MEEPGAVAPSDPLPEPAPRFVPEAQAEPEAETVAAPTDSPEVAAASEPAPLSPAYPKPGKKKPGAAGAQKREGAVAALVWAGLAVFLAGILGAAAFYRVEVVRLAPRLASAYAAAGLPVNTVGLTTRVTGPEGIAGSVEIVAGDEAGMARFADTSRSGVYTMRVPGRADRAFANGSNRVRLRKRSWTHMPGSSRNSMRGGRGCTTPLESRTT